MSSPTPAPATPITPSSPPPPDDTPPPPPDDKPPPPPDDTPPPPPDDKPPPPPDDTPPPPPDDKPPPPDTTPPPPDATPPPPDTTPPPPDATPPPPDATPSPPVAASPPPPVASPPVVSPPPPSNPSSSPPPPSDPSSSPPPPSPIKSPPPPPSSIKSPPPPLITPSPPGTKSSPPPPLSQTASSPPPPPPPPSPPPSGSTSDSSTITTGLVVGIAVAGVTVLVVLSLLFILCKKKRRRDRSDNHYIPPPPKDGPYGAPQQHWQQSNPPPAEHVVNMMPKPSPPPAFQSRPPKSPPPPLFIASSGGSGSYYSGSTNPPLTPPSPGTSLGFSQSMFTYEELAMATDGFSDANLLGQGGFGYVYRGILPNGKEVAVKQLKVGSGQGEREFQAEVEIISRVHHKHLVSLVGYCMTGSDRLLVYEFVPNNTMEFHLHGKGRPVMDWPTRMKIALGSAKGLAYLHEDCHPKIIHRDIKAANILIDFMFEAQVADFGLAKLTSDLNTHVTTRVMGTFGYLAPEYAASGKLTEKSDVFSFGVMLLELITGRRPVDTKNTNMGDSLVDWARPLITRALEEGNFSTLVDERLKNDYNHDEMLRMVSCAAASVRHSARRRPRMSQIVRALEGQVSLSDINNGIKPGHSTAYGSYGSSDYDISQYKEDMKKFRKMALGGSSEYSSGNQTSESGLNPSGSSSEGQNTREMEMGKTKRNNNHGFSGSS